MKKDGLRGGGGGGDATYDSANGLGTLRNILLSCERIWRLLFSIVQEKSNTPQLLADEDIDALSGIQAVCIGIQAVIDALG